MNTAQAFKELQRLKRSISGKEKGDIGESVVQIALQEYQRNIGLGTIYASYKYPCAKDKNRKEYSGNIFKTDKGYITKDGGTDEIDLLYVTMNRIIVIEVKAYGARGGFKLYDKDEMYQYKSEGGEKKLIIAQTEKHCRHLYHTIYNVIPNGDPRYIVGMLVIADKQVLTDGRSPDLRHYIPAVILNNFKNCVRKLDKTLDFYIDEESVNSRLDMVGHYKGINK